MFPRPLWERVREKEVMPLCHCERMRSNPTNINNKTVKEGQMNYNKNHVITRKDNEQIKNILEQSDVVIPDTEHQCYPEQKKLAFTLAEVLITLGIIGIVAAMTIPTLITNHQKKQTVVKLQRAISVLNQAYRLAYDDVGEASAQESLDMGAEEYFKKFWAPYIKVHMYCDSYSTCGYDRDTFDTLNYTNKPMVVPNNMGTAFITTDGIFYNIRVAGGTADNSSGEIFVDLNGPKKPNMIGKDVFILSRVDDDVKGGVVVPFCSGNDLEDINSQCSAKGTMTSNGYCCAEKIKRAGWNIDKSYPW